MYKTNDLNNVTDLRDGESKQKDDKPKESSKVKNNLPIKKIILAIVALILIVNGAFAYGVYGLGWNNKATKAFVKIFPYPAALHKGGYITLNSYFENLGYYKKYYEVAQSTDFKTEEGKKIFTTLKEDLLNQLIEEKIIEKEAKKLNLKVEEAEIGEEYKNLAEESGEDTLIKQIKDYYGWSVKTFKTKIRSMLLAKKLEEKIKNDESLNSEEKEKAEEALKRIQNGEDFAELAKEVSEDPSATDGGNLSWFERGKMPVGTAELEDTTFALEPGQVTSIVKTTEGFYIVKVNEKKENEISASIILIKSVSFEEWIREKQTEYSVKKLLNIDKIKI